LGSSPSRPAQAALAKSGRAARVGRTEADGAQQAAEGVAAEREAFLLDELVRKVMVVEASVAGAHQPEDGLADAFRQAGWWLGLPKLA